MFLAIINDTYSEVKADYSIGRGPDFQLGKMIKKVRMSNSPTQNSEANLVGFIPPSGSAGRGSRFLLWSSVIHICTVSLPGEMFSGFKM